MAHVPTELSAVQNQIQKFWSPIFVPELKETSVLPSLVSSDYDGEIKQGGDTVYVSMIQNAVGATQAIDGATGSHRVISAEAMVTQRVGITADQIFTASFELDNLIDLQSQIGSPAGQSKIREALLTGVEKQINAYLYSLVAPSAAAPDHLINTVPTFNFTQLMNLRKLASLAKWPKNDWFCLLDPSYMNDFLSDDKNINALYVDGKPVQQGGNQIYQRAGFSVVEDNSDACVAMGTAGAGVAFHKTFMYLVMQMQPTFKLSDLHATKKRGYLLTVDLVGGAKLGLQGNKKHIKVTSA